MDDYETMIGQFCFVLFCKNTLLQPRKLWVRFPMGSLHSSIDLILLDTTAPASTQPRAEMSIWYLFEGQARPMLKVDSLTAIRQ
jgi:hypothetical protein